MELKARPGAFGPERGHKPRHEPCAERRGKSERHQPVFTAHHLLERALTGVELRQRPAYMSEVARAVAIESDRKSTRLNSSHRCISYAVFCLKKKKKKRQD